ncbi:MAG: hypothetical protein ACEQSX_03615 [Baekduiaceae bacterium]
MSKLIVDIANVSIDHSGGAYELETVAKINIDKSQTSTPVQTMNRRRRAIGYKHGAAEFKVSMEVEMLLGTPEVDWDTLLETKEEFQIYYERGDGGKKRQLADMVIDSISEPHDKDGASMQTLTCWALDDRAED